MPRRKRPILGRPNKTTRFWRDRQRCMHGWDCTTCCWTLTEPSRRTVANRYRHCRYLPFFLTAADFTKADIVAWVVAPNPITFAAANHGAGVPVRLSHTCGNDDCYSVHHLHIEWNPAPQPAPIRQSRKGIPTKLLPHQIDRICADYANGTTAKVLANRYGISHQYVYMLARKHKTQANS